MRAARLVLLLALGIAGSMAGLAQNLDDPVPVIRALVLAMYSGDVPSFEKLTIPHPQRSRLTAGARSSPEKLQQLKEYPEGLQVRKTRPLMAQGKPVEPGRDGRLPLGTTGVYVVSHGGGPMSMRVIKQNDGWKIDLRWWLAMTEMGREPPPDSPDRVIKPLLMAMLEGDREKAATFITDRRTLDYLFLGAPRQREPSGVLEGNVMEMPLVEVSTGDFFALVNDRVVEGGTTADRKLVVGMFGPVEIPFEMKRLGTDWKVQAEPYFAYMNR
jgi:hypothetical protein